MGVKRGKLCSDQGEGGKGIGFGSSRGIWVIESTYANAWYAQHLNLAVRLGGTQLKASCPKSATALGPHIALPEHLGEHLEHFLASLVSQIVWHQYKTFMEECNKNSISKKVVA